MAARRLLLLLFLFVCVRTSLRAQQSGRAPLPSGPTGTVSGSVTFAESRLPARFVPIVLVPQPPPDTDTPPPSDNQVFRVAIVRGSTGMDGQFHLEGVPVGDYYLAAALPGASNAAMLSWFSATDEEVKKLLDTFQTVSVTAGSAVSVPVILHVGAVISGRVQYADGAPVVMGAIAFTATNNGLTNPALRARARSLRRDTLALLSSAVPSVGESRTDDAGRFRIYGVPPGKYTLSTVMMLDHQDTATVSYSNGRASNEQGYLQNETVPVFAPSTFRRADARVFDIHEGEQITDADITIDPQNLHALRGKALIASSQQPCKGSIVMLRESSSKEPGRFVPLKADGSFQFNMLAAGSYELRMVPMSCQSPDAVEPPPSSPLHVYKSVRQTVLIDDHDVVLDDILLVPAGPRDRNDDLFAF